MNTHEKIALEQIGYALDWVVGSYRDDMKDGTIKKMPSRVDLIDDVYEQLMHWTHTETGLSSEPTYQVRLAGKDFIISRITEMLKVKMRNK